MRGDAMKRFSGLCVLGLFLVAAIPAWATDGYFANGYGTSYKAMAGAGVALSLRSS